MTKKEAKEIFGTVRNIYEALGCTRQNWSQFKDPLTDANKQRVIGAAIMNGIDVPEKFK